MLKSFESTEMSSREYDRWNQRPVVIKPRVSMQLSTGFFLASLTTVCMPYSLQAQGSQPLTFGDVMVRQHKSEKDRRLVDKGADLILDDNARKLIVKAARPIEVSYDAVEKVIFEVTQHMRGMNKGGLLAALGGGALVGAAVGGQKVKDYLCYLEFRLPGESLRPFVLEIGKDSSDQVIAKMRSLFADKVGVPEYQLGDEIKEALKDVDSKHEVKVIKAARPLPEIKPDKALVVVVCPTPSARAAGKGNQFKLHAGDRVVAVNKMGTWTFGYVDPGEYLMVSQAENANGFGMKLEAGGDYYFLQNVHMGFWKNKTSLARHSRELVAFEAAGAYFADWQRKSP